MTTYILSQAQGGRDPYKTEEYGRKEVYTYDRLARISTGRRKIKKKNVYLIISRLQEGRSPCITEEYGKQEAHIYDRPEILNTRSKRKEMKNDKYKLM